MQTLTTARLDLVPLDPDRDAESLHAMHGDPEVSPYGPAEITADVAATRRRLVDELRSNGGWTWALRLRPDPEAIGTIGLFSDQGTSIRGVSWSLSRQYWGRGLMGEAAPIIVDHLLAQPGIDAVEAWIDTRNTRSIGVARRAQLDERARLNRVYADHGAQQVVMARAAEPHDPEVLAVRPRVPVRDVPRTCRQLIEILGLTLSVEVGDPPVLARLALDRWSGSPGLDVTEAGSGDIAATSITVDVGIPTDVVHERAVASGLRILSPPVDRPWHTREFEFCLPEGHQIRVAGPTRPPGAPVSPDRTDP